ncbi:MAG: PAS domain S-box protein [Cyclobacteriaceae bacterium]|nr:PAS domain S-box protein [Cyclobacteriaceae bacterium]
MSKAILNELSFQLMLDSTPGSLILVNEDGYIVYVNRSTENLFQYQREELIGQKIELLIAAKFSGHHPELRNGFFDKIQSRAMGKGRDLYARKKGGEEFPVEIGLNPLITVQGKMVIASVIDITERKISEDQFKMAVQSTPNGIVVIDKKGIITMVNNQTLKMFGYSEEELLGNSIDMLVPSSIKKQHVHYRNDFNEKPEMRSMGIGRDLYALNKNGTEFPVEIGLSPFESHSGSKVLASIIDITARKKDESDLQNYMEQLTIKNEEIKNFSYIVSHDLKEPVKSLNGIIKLLEFELGKNVDNNIKEYLIHINRSTTRMERLITDLLDYSKIGMEKTRSEVNCDLLVASVLEDLSGLIQKNNAKITVSKLGVINAYETELRLLFQNLINNAIKFRNSENPTVQITCNKDKNGLIFSIEDNGIGIAPENQSKIFEIFSRLHSKDEFEGTGIGLAHCKKIVELHNGWIKIESELGKGSKFTFCLNQS